MATTKAEKHGQIMVLTLANPPVNALSHGLRVALAAGLDEANRDPEIKAIVITGEGRAFSAGADITEFGSGRQEPVLPDVIDHIEASPKPVIAAVNGLALGGGFEIPLGCHYRIISQSVKQLGLPEVKIGVLPGAGGTQRLPRLIGVEKSVDLIVSGSNMSAADALAAGLADHVTDGDVVKAAIVFAEELVAKGAGARPTGARDIDASNLAPDFFDKKRASLARHPSGPLAPLRCIDAVEVATKLPLAEGLKRERGYFMELVVTPYAKALQHAFFAERQAANIPGLGKSITPRTIKSVGVIGAGTMGTGIALAHLAAGLPVTLVEMKQDALDSGVARIKETIEGLAKRGRLTPELAAKQLAGLTPSLDLASLSQADLVIEAVFESMAIKKEVFGKLDHIAKPGAILATNTSTLDVDEIAAATSRPQDVLGLHFFSPANIMKLLEVVNGKATAPEALAASMALAKTINKVGVVSGVCHGFIGNRMVESYMEEVQAMLLEGASPAEIDKAHEAWGWAMGPLAVMDLAGMDVGYRIRKEHKISDARRKLYAVADALVESGRVGQKTGAGIYTYGADRKRTLDTKVAEMFRTEAAKQGIQQRNDIPAEEIVERTLLRLINTGAQIVDEGIAFRSSDIDVVYMYGYGFPGWRGGPMWQADHLGLKTVAERIRHYEKLYGKRWSPAPLIDKLAAAEGSFAATDKAKGKG